VQAVREGGVREVGGQGGAVRGDGMAAAVPSGGEGSVLDGEVQRKSFGGCEKPLQGSGNGST